jgi:hypothetical protein
MFNFNLTRHLAITEAGRHPSLSGNAGQGGAGGGSDIKSIVCRLELRYKLTRLVFPFVILLFISAFNTNHIEFFT